MAKAKQQIVYMIPEGESRDSHTYHYSTIKTKSMISDGKKLKLRKFNPVKNKHEMFVEAKLPKHTK